LSVSTTTAKPDIDRGYVLPADRPKKAPATKTVEHIGDDGSVETIEVVETSLLNRPDIALAALVHTMAPQDLLGRAPGRGTRMLACGAIS
jgi:hypothetical protein